MSDNRTNTREFVNQLSEYKTRSIEAFDKGILTLSAGAIVLSVTFVKVIVEKFPTPYDWMLLFSWISFALAVVVILGSHLVSIKIMNEAYERKKKEVLGEEEDENKKDWNSVAIWCRWISGGGFIVGLSLLFVFAWLNLGDGEMAKKIESDQTGKSSREVRGRDGLGNYIKSIEEPFQDLETLAELAKKQKSEEGDSTKAKDKK